MKMIAALLLLVGCATGPRSFKEEIAETIENHRSDFHQCYKNQLSSARNLPSGKVDTFFVIEPNGKVSKAEVQNTTLQQPKVEACILQTIKNFSFPKPTDGIPKTVHYPFTFKEKAD